MRQIKDRALARMKRHSKTKTIISGNEKATPIPQSLIINNKPDSEDEEEQQINAFFSEPKVAKEKEVIFYKPATNTQRISPEKNNDIATPGNNENISTKAPLNTLVADAISKLPFQANSFALTNSKTILELIGNPVSMKADEVLRSASTMDEKLTFITKLNLKENYYTWAIHFFVAKNINAIETLKEKGLYNQAKATMEHIHTYVLYTYGVDLERISYKENEYFSTNNVTSKEG